MGYIDDITVQNEIDYWLANTGQAFINTPIQRKFDY